MNPFITIFPCVVVYLFCGSGCMHLATNGENVNNDKL